MRIAIKRQPVGLQGQHLLQGVGQAGQCLMRQSIEQIHVQAFDTCAAQHVDHMCGLFKRLRATDGLLHHRRKVLNTDAGAVHAIGRQHVQQCVGRFGGINLYREFKIIGFVKGIEYPGQKPLHCLRA